MRCLIEETEKGDLKLHDILHDLASYIGGKEYSHDFAIDYTRHLSLPSVDVEAMPSASRGKSKLRTLLSTHESLFQSPIVAHLTNFKWLRVLSLEYCEIRQLPRSIGNLSLLKYLDLSNSGVRKLPTSIGRLCNLQTLNLDDSMIKELPKEMGELCNLRHLGLQGTWRLKFIAEGLGKLSNLQTLNKFILCDHRENTRGCNMRELIGLSKLKGELSIGGLGRSRKAIHDAEEAPQLLKEKCGLISLNLDFKKPWDENVASSASEQSGVLEALEPPRGLKELKIYFYKGQMPAWFLQPNYAMLHTLELYNCPLWVKVISINSLESICVRDCPTLCEIPSMPLLKFLHVSYCAGLNTIGGDMPALESLTVWGCPSASLGWGLLKQLPNLIKLDLDKGALDSALPSPLPSEVSTFLPSLKRLSLWDLNDDDPKWGRVPDWVWGLSQLEYLKLARFDEEISLGGHWQCLQKLRRLALDSFPHLKSLVDINMIPQQNNAVATPATTDENQQIACLSRLEELKILFCPSLDLPQELTNCLKGLLTIF